MSSRSIAKTIRNEKADAILEKLFAEEQK